MASSLKINALVAMTFLGMYLPVLLYMDFVVEHGHLKKPPVHENALALISIADDSKTAATASTTVLSDTIIPKVAPQELFWSAKPLTTDQNLHG